MQIKKIILTTILSFIALSIVAQVVVIHRSEIVEIHNGKSCYVHTVQKGQTIYSISKVYDVTPDEIYFENPGSKQGIGINQRLLIPTTNKETELKNEIVATNFDFFYHVAANNETFEHISSIYLIPRKYIVKANPNLQTPLREGEYVKVPVEDAFDILDGKAPSRVADVGSNRNVNTRPAYTPATKKPTTTTVQSNSTKYQTQPIPSKIQIQQPTSETISFNPDIPVIQDYRHVVILGETTQTVAKKYDIPVDILKAANPGLGNSVAKGDRLRVPDKTKIESLTKKQPETKSETEIKESSIQDDSLVPASAKQEVEIIKHIVKKKETLYSIGREYGVTVAELMKANKGLTTTIKIGQVILVPKKKINTPYLIHTVQSNTRAKKIARLYRIPMYQLKEFNPTLEKRVYQNQDLKIPVGSYANIVPLLPVDEITLGEDEKFEKHPVDTKLTEKDCSFAPDTRRTFKVALMVPFSLEEADSLNRAQFLLSRQNFFAPFRFIQFYEGALIALDSLTKQGMKAEMYVYDVDNNLAKTAKVLQQRELRKMDLIIGPFYSNSFDQVALFAGNFNIPIVNPVSYRETILNDYSTVIKAKPCTSSQIKIIESFINNFAKDSKVFLISQTSYQDADKVIEINNRILSVLEPQIKVNNNDLFNLAFSAAKRNTLFLNTNVPPPFIFEGTEIYPEILEGSISDSTLINNFLIRINYATDSLYPFLRNASPLRNNLVILYGSQKSFILDALNRLNEHRDTFDIQLIGIPTWERINNLTNVKMDNLNLTYLSSTYINYNAESTQDFIHTFRKNFSTEPDEYAFSGFDISYYFLSSLYYLGDDFNNCLEHFPMELLQSQYNFKKVGDTNNFENDYWNMLQLKRLSIFKIPDDLLITGEQVPDYD
ncbi:MAG: LysM peptidoglycan-binding domain-containing protein [Bacteroidetes bacterium]|nr:LysM peptidoglycan-binding domain-containing protein [Bacteroidota bacterium]MBL6943876.1 LysM peptidoglycan-binding domain-containing protein [Bacteroidales bacterium]